MDLTGAGQQSPDRVRMTTNNLSFILRIGSIFILLLNIGQGANLHGKNLEIVRRDQGVIPHRGSREISRRSVESLHRDLDYKYAVVIDAGSTGSRARIYRWLPETSETSLPEISEVNNSKIVPGVSEYADNKLELERHVSQLIDRSRVHVPAPLHSISPIYFMATAGMRMLLENKAYTSIQQVQDILSNSSINPFWFRYTENARILSGEEEGVFAWIAVNYLSGVFKHNGGKSRETYGILELGGASTQIAFVPRGNILADKFPILIGGVVYSLYVHSYLHYGQKYVDKWIKEQLCIAQNCTYNPSAIVENPCMLIEDERTDEVGTHRITFRGSGEPAQCSAMLHKLVYKAAEPWHCYPKPCAIGTSYQPSIQSSMQFYALGAFIHSMQTLRIISPDVTSVSPTGIQEAAFEFCRRPMSTMHLVRPGKKNYLSTECLMGLYIPILFTKGYGFNNDSNQIQVVRTINNHPIEWSLGAVLYENERRSCKHCPSIRTACSVGSNADHLTTRLSSPVLLTTLLYSIICIAGSYSRQVIGN